MGGGAAKAEPGMSLVLRLTPRFSVGHLVGTKEVILAGWNEGEDLVSCALDRPLKLVAENEAWFTTIP